MDVERRVIDFIRLNAIDNAIKVIKSGKCDCNKLIPNTKHYQPNTSVFMAAVRSNNTTLVGTLLSPLLNNGTSVDPQASTTEVCIDPNPPYFNPLYEVLRLQLKIEIIEMLLAAGCKTDKLPTEGEDVGLTSICVLIRSTTNFVMPQYQDRFLKILNLLVSHGANKDGNDLMSPVTAAAQTDNLFVLKALINIGSDLTIKHVAKYEPIQSLEHVCARNNAHKCLRYLLHLQQEQETNNSSATSPPVGLDKLNVDDYWLDVQQTPLHMAVAHDALESAKLLLEYGCDVGRLDSNSDSPLRVLISPGYYNTSPTAMALLELLDDHGADFDEFKDRGEQQEALARFVKPHPLQGNYMHLLRSGF